MWKNWHPSQSHSVRACRLAYDALMDNSFPSVWNFCPFYRGKARNANKKLRLNLVVLRRVDAAFHEIPSMMFYIRHILFCVTEGPWSRFIFVSLWEKEKEKKEEKKEKKKKILVFFTVYYLVIRISKFPMFWNSVMSRQKNFFLRYDQVAIVSV